MHRPSNPGWPSAAAESSHRIVERLEGQGICTAVSRTGQRECRVVRTVVACHRHYDGVLARLEDALLRGGLGECCFQGGQIIGSDAGHPISRRPL